MMIRVVLQQEANLQMCFMSQRDASERQVCGNLSSVALLRRHVESRVAVGINGVDAHRV